MRVNRDDIKFLPPAWREAIAKFAEATKYDEGTILAGLLAHEQIKQLDAEERPKAIAIVVRMHEVQVEAKL